MSLLPTTAGRPVGTVVQELKEVLSRIMSETSRVPGPASERCRLLARTLQDMRRAIQELKKREDVGPEDKRLVKAIAREETRIEPLLQKLNVLEQDAKARERAALVAAAEAEQEQEALEARVGNEGMLWDDDQHAKATKEEVEKIAREMEIINAMKAALGQTVEATGEHLEEVEHNTSQAVEKSDAALGELKGGVKNAYGGMGTTFGVVAGAICGGVGLGLGLAVAPIAAVGVGGALAGRYVGKKVAKQAVKNATTGIDAHLAASPAQNSS